jgi:hypothetical protein
LLVLFKVNAFPFKNKDKSHIFQAKATFTLCSAATCSFCFEAICDRYFFKLNCFKLIGWFNHYNVFPPIRSVCYRFLHCDYRKLHCDYKKLHCYYRKLHCDYRKLHCCLGLTALKSTNHSRVISLCILLYYKLSIFILNYGTASIGEEINIVYSFSNLRVVHDFFRKLCQ